MPRARAPQPPILEPPREAPRPRPGPVAESSARGLTIADAGLLLLFLGLTFLLGVFPLNDTDFWWHLRTGDLIRQQGRLPHTDWYTFGAAGHAWIDLHWGFQVALSWLYSLGGVDATNLAKCVVTTVAVSILLLSRQKSWPLWVMVLAWLPALLLLGGRMYVRPETVSLLYLAIDLAILTRIDRMPKLAWIIPVVQILWVNTQGLFIFGPIVLSMALIDAALRRGAFSRERRAWWRIVLGATVATGVACLLNPYGIFGALYPLQLAGTMTNPAFNGIQELQSIPDFIESAGLRNLPLQLHFLTLLLGGMSFVLPVLWRVYDRVANPPVEVAEPSRRKAKKRAKTTPAEPPWRLSPFRVLLFAAFSLLSWKATRNSHQFAAVVGAVTAWNFGEWAGAVSRRRAENRQRSSETAIALIPRLAVSGMVGVAIVLVGGGQFYGWAKEGRTVGWGERPLWFPHEAARFAGTAGFPEKFLVFHNGHAGLFEYYNSPKQKVFADARLEVMGPDVYGDDMELGAAVALESPGWIERIKGLGTPTPGVLVDHVQLPMAPLAATLLGSRAWRCVWYDPVASVYLHESVTHPTKAVDFAARHFGREPDSEPRGQAALAVSSKSLMVHAMGLLEKGHRPELAATLMTLGQGHARRALALDRTSADHWRTLGQLEMLRDAGMRPEPVPRFKMPFDLLFDLSSVRATHDLLEADRLAAEDFSTVQALFSLFANREMNEAAAVMADRLLAFPRTRDRSAKLSRLTPMIGRVRAATKRVPKTTWENLGELDRLATSLLADGRAETAADLLERAYTPAERTWDQTDLLATIRLHLGRPDLARALWQGAVTVPRPAVRDARVAVTYLVQGDLDSARSNFRAAIAAEPNLFEAHYGLAILERDAGRADGALSAAMAAEAAASSDLARAAAREIVAFVRPYAKTGGGKN
ncbi:MAG: hypothetical protein JWN86_1134 [Planctomycetota bacterium]|nr:hypothetical protein [Planctomycetota bacterium]